MLSASRVRSNTHTCKKAMSLGRKSRLQKWWATDRRTCQKSPTFLSQSSSVQDLIQLLSRSITVNCVWMMAGLQSIWTWIKACSSITVPVRRIIAVISKHLRNVYNNPFKRLDCMLHIFRKNIKCSYQIIHLSSSLIGECLGNIHVYEFAINFRIKPVVISKEQWIKLREVPAEWYWGSLFVVKVRRILLKLKLWNWTNYLDSLPFFPNRFYIPSSVTASAENRRLARSRIWP